MICRSAVREPKVLPYQRSTTANCRDNRDLRAVAQGCRQPACKPDTLVAHENVHVRSNLALLGHHPVAHSGVERPERFESVAHRCRRARDFHLRTPGGETAKRTRNVKDDLDYSLMGAV